MKIVLIGRGKMGRLIAETARAAGDEVEAVYYLEDGAPTEVIIADKTVSLNRLHIAERGGRGTKLRK